MKLKKGRGRIPSAFGFVDYINIILRPFLNFPGDQGNK